MDETLLERYRHDPSAVIQAIEFAARRERARVIKELFAKAAEALFGRRRDQPAEPRQLRLGDAGLKANGGRRMAEGKPVPVTCD